MRHLQRFILAIQFLTRIPITKKAMPCEPEDFKGAMAFFTTIGVIIGVLQYISYVLAANLLNAEMAAVVSCVVGIWLTGGLHLDGLADLGDALGANASKERSLEIMKDSRVGTFGVIAIVLDVLVHLIGIYALRAMPYLYILVPVGAKLAVCILCFIGKSIKKGMGSLWIENIKWTQIIINLMIMSTIGVFTIGLISTVIGVLALIIGVYAFNRLCVRRLGGLNGDCLGAMSQLTEWGAIIFLIGLMNFK